MGKDRFISPFSYKTNGSVESLWVIWNIVMVKLPEILFVGEEIHDFTAVRVIGKRLKRRNNPFIRDGITDYVEV